MTEPTGFSWPAFFLGPFWAFKHKMYVNGCIGLPFCLLVFVHPTFMLFVGLVYGFNFNKWKNRSESKNI